MRIDAFRKQSYDNINPKLFEVWKIKGPNSNIVSGIVVAVFPKQQRVSFLQLEDYQDTRTPDDTIYCPIKIRGKKKFIDVTYLQNVHYSRLNGCDLIISDIASIQSIINLLDTYFDISINCNIRDQRLKEIHDQINKSNNKNKSPKNNNDLSKSNDDILRSIEELKAILISFIDSIDTNNSISTTNNITIDVYIPIALSYSSLSCQSHSI